MFATTKKLNPLLTILFLLTCLFSLLLTLVRQAETAQPQLETVRLTDVTQTNGFVLGPKIAEDTDRIHVSWSEDTNTNEGFDLFYRQLPFGETINLSDHAQSEGLNTISSWSVLPSPDKNTAVIWSEYTPNMNSDLFIWRESYTTPLNLSVPDLTLGNVATSQLFIDSNSNAYVLWAENTMNGSSSEELYLWNEATGTRQALSQDAFGGTISNLQAVLENDALFAIWSEYAGSVEPGGPFFWNSISNLRQNLSSLTNPVSFPSALKLNVTPGNIAHVIWLEAVDSFENVCPYHWDSTSDVTESLIPDTNDCLARSVTSAQDANGHIHIIWANEISLDTIGLYYWDVNSSTKITVTETIQDSDISFQQYSNFLALTPGQANVLWIADSMVANEGKDLYYWNSTNQTVQNLSDHALTYEGSGVDLAMEFTFTDTAGTLHVLWSEQNANISNSGKDLFYWNSADQVTIHLSDPTVVAENSYGAIAALDSNNIAHVIWEGQVAGSTDNGLFYWNSDTAQTQALPTTSPEGTNINHALAADNSGNIHIAWSGESGISGEDKNVYYWNGSENPIDLSDTTLTEGSSGTPFVTVSSDDKLFVTWVESFDLFSAFEAQQLSNKIYLPILVK